MNSGYKILGAAGEPVKISFGRGTITQAHDDRTVGGVNFGYDDSHDFGVTYIEGKLYSSRVLDIVLSANEDGTENVKIFYVDDEGTVQEKDFRTADRELIDLLISTAVSEAKTQIDAETDEKIAQAGQQVPEYRDSDYIAIVPEDNAGGEGEEGEDDEESGIRPAFQVRVRYDELFTQIREDLHIEDAEQDERLIGIEHGYATGVESTGVSADERTESFRATMKSRETKDDEFTVTGTDFRVPTDHFYEVLDASIADIYGQLEKKADWQDVHDLLNTALEEG